MAQLATAEPRVRGYMAATLKTMDRARSLTQQLLTFSKGGTPDKKVMTLPPFLEETARFAMSGSKASLHLSIAEDLWRCAYDPNQMAQVINNIIINGQQAMPEGGRLEVKARNREIDGDRHASLPAGG
jgi:signal transduction histidine kinase